MVIERATGKPLSHELGRRVIEPLRLKNTTFEPGPLVSTRVVHGYAPSQHDGIVAGPATARDRSRASASWAGAAGAIVTSAPDLSRFVGALIRGALLPEPLLALMLPPPGARYGLGLASFATPCGAAVGHTGNLLGTVSAVWSTRDGRRRLVAMTNSYPLSPGADTTFRTLLETAFCG
jgi:D-alanyl-D-alanine carboxypeptidase